VILAQRLNTSEKSSAKFSCEGCVALFGAPVAAVKSASVMLRKSERTREFLVHFGNHDENAQSAFNRGQLPAPVGMTARVIGAGLPQALDLTGKGPSKFSNEYCSQVGLGLALAILK
jgi:hypothetical protein